MHLPLFALRINRKFKQVASTSESMKCGSILSGHKSPREGHCVGTMATHQAVPSADTATTTLPNASSRPKTSLADLGAYTRYRLRLSEAGQHVSGCVVACVSRVDRMLQVGLFGHDIAEAVDGPVPREPRMATPKAGTKSVGTSETSNGDRYIPLLICICFRVVRSLGVRVHGLPLFSQ